MLLEVKGIDAFYGDFQALFGVGLAVDEGETVAVIGANGAGKSTLLRAMTALLPIAAGSITLRGNRIDGLQAHRIARFGIAMVPEGRQLFPSLTVEENLRMGALSRRSGVWTLDRVYELFPVLQERRSQSATTLSGGQQQMAAIGRALMANPDLLLCDELSLGLAPVVIKDIYRALERIRAEGTTVILIEQDTHQALAVADRLYCLQEGRVSLEGRTQDVSRAAITEAYFGVKVA